MSKGIFTDRNRKPTAKSIESAVGRAGTNWKKMNEFLGSAMKLKCEMKFYGVNYGWAIRYAKAGKSVISLYPARDSFTAQVILKRDEVDAALRNELSADTKAAVIRAHEFKEGRWVYLDVSPSGGIEDVKVLVAARLGVR